VNEAASNWQMLRTDGTQYSLWGLGARADGFGGEERVCLHRVIVWIGRLFLVNEIKYKTFSYSSLKSIVIPLTVEILGSGCFSQPSLVPNMT
jgi:hypothetical protein